MSLDKLLPYQVPHTLQLYEALKVNQCVLDASDTGTGKTYCALTVCKLSNLTPLIICPKSVINNWLTVAKTLGIDILGISNYEMLKGCKYYTMDMKAVECPYIDKYSLPEDKTVGTTSSQKNVDNATLTTDTKDLSNIKPKKTKKVKEGFIFQFPKDVVIIFDEAHRCKNHKTIISRLLISAAEARNKVILLSATISDKIQCFKPFGVVLGFYDDVTQFGAWMRRKMKLREIHRRLCKLEGKEYDIVPLKDTELRLSIIHNEVFPRRGSRIKIKELGDLFPKNQVVANCYHSDNHDKINELYDIINSALGELKNKETRAHGLGKLIRARQKIEMFKVPIIMDLAEEAMDSGYSVVIFVNFHDTMNYICHHMECDCTIHGQQSLDERQSCINDFQSNKSKMIVAIIQAGGVGVSLHDLHGGHPRMSIISPTWSGQDMVQALGRIHRAGSKTPAMQRIVYCAKTYEEQICATIQNKIRNINAINDGDLVLKPLKPEDLKIVEENIKKMDDDDEDEEKSVKLDKKKTTIKKTDQDTTENEKIKGVTDKEIKVDEDKPIKLTKHNRPKGKYIKLPKP